jgi:hypothetical protein
VHFITNSGFRQWEWQSNLFSLTLNCRGSTFYLWRVLPVLFAYVKVLQIPGSSSPGATKVCTVTHNICRPSVWNLVHVAHLLSSALGWILIFLKICPPVVYISTEICNS